jgi:hypothetical protein
METVKELTEQSLEGGPVSDMPDSKRLILSTNTRDNITFVCPDYGVIVDAERFDSNGQAELTFWHDMEPDVIDSKPQLLLQTRASLLSSSNTANLIKRLQNSDGDLSYLPWNWILTRITGQVLKNAREGEPIKHILPSEDDSLTPAYLLEPILYLNHPTVIFGDYGSLKSLFALVIAYVAQLPYLDNKLGLTTGKESAICLYLDYEGDELTLRKRWSAIRKGFGIEPIMDIRYLRMTTPLADSIESLEKGIRKEKVKLLIVDSLGPAARGNLNDPEPAIKYHEALRKLGITSLTLAHNAKDFLTKKRTIFGSVFFTNLARSVWECKAEQETGEDEAIISLKHTKANLSRLHSPLGYKFTFTNDSIAIAKADLRDTGLSSELPLPWQIKNLLKQGPLSIQELTERLDSKADTIGRTLRRLRTKTQVVRLEDDTWGLTL